MQERRSLRLALSATAMVMMSAGLVTIATNSPAAAQNIVFPPGTDCTRLLDSMREACMNQARAQQHSVIGSQGVTIPNNSIPSGTLNNQSGPNNPIGQNPMPNSANPNAAAAPNMTLSPNSTSPGRVIEPNSTSPGQVTSPNSTSPNGMTPNPMPAIITPNGTIGGGSTIGGSSGGAATGTGRTGVGGSGGSGN